VNYPTDLSRVLRRGILHSPYGLEPVPVDLRSNGAGDGLLRKVPNMATLFKPNRSYTLPEQVVLVRKGSDDFVRIPDGKRNVLYPLSEDGRHYLKPAAKWAADVRLADGSRKRYFFSPNKDAASVMLSELLKKIENEKAGILDRYGEHRKRLLKDHLEEWKASLEASGRPPHYIVQKQGRAKKAFDGCGFLRTQDMNAERLEAYLYALRQGEDKLSIQTTNDWLQAVRQFCRWMVANSRMERDPFTRLRPGNVKAGLTLRRGEFSEKEYHGLIAMAETRQAAYRGLDGPARAMLYRVAVNTGYRVKELASLTPDSFDLEARTPAIILGAEFTKNGTAAVQPISNELVALLRPYLATCPKQQPVWPGTWREKAAKMLRLDLQAAKIPFKVDGPEGEETRDFHSLRGCYISNVIRAGADLKQAMTLARHSDPKLTTARYARTRLHDLGALVNKLPGSKELESARLPMTGTDGETAFDAQQRAQQSAATGAANGGNGRLRLMTGEESHNSERDGESTSQSLNTKGNDDVLGRVKRSEDGRESKPPARLELATYALRKRRSTN